MDDGPSKPTHLFYGSLEHAMAKQLEGGAVRFPAQHVFRFFFLRYAALILFVCLFCAVVVVCVVLPAGVRVATGGWWRVRCHPGGHSRGQHQYQLWWHRYCHSSGDRAASQPALPHTLCVCVCCESVCPRTVAICSTITYFVGRLFFCTYVR